VTRTLNEREVTASFSNLREINKPAVCNRHMPPISEYK
jgi:hypothetical protein